MISVPSTTPDWKIELKKERNVIGLRVIHYEPYTEERNKSSSKRHNQDSKHIWKTSYRKNEAMETVAESMTIFAQAGSGCTLEQKKEKANGVNIA